MDENFVSDAHVPKLIGFARVNMSSLSSIEGGRGIVPRVVKALQQTFTVEKCRRNDPSNYVTALVTATSLRKLLKASGFEERDLRAPLEDGLFPFLRLPTHVKLFCADGRQRLKAGEEFLDPSDRWWTVQVYQVPPGCLSSLRYNDIC